MFVSRFYHENLYITAPTIISMRRPQSATGMRHTSKAESAIALTVTGKCVEVRSNITLIGPVIKARLSKSYSP